MWKITIACHCIKKFLTMINILIFKQIKIKVSTNVYFFVFFINFAGRFINILNKFNSIMIVGVPVNAADNDVFGFLIPNFYPYLLLQILHRWI